MPLEATVLASNHETADRLLNGAFHPTDEKPVCMCHQRWWRRSLDLLKGAQAPGAEVLGAHNAIDHHFGLLDVRLEHAALLRGAQSPSNTVLISNVAAKHFLLAAFVTLSQGPSPLERKTLDNYR